MVTITINPRYNANIRGEYLLVEDYELINDGYYTFTEACQEMDIINNFSTIHLEKRGSPCKNQYTRKSFKD